MKKFIVIAALLAAGCATQPVPIIAKIPVPANLTVRCPDIPAMDSPATLGTTVQYITGLQEQYSVCAGRFDSLIEVTNLTPSDDKDAQGK